MLTQEHLAMSKRRALAKQLCSIIELFTTPKYGEYVNLMKNNFKNLKLIVFLAFLIVSYQQC
jgi:hypothetical protein